MSVGVFLGYVGSGVQLYGFINVLSGLGVSQKLKCRYISKFLLPTMPVYIDPVPHIHLPHGGPGAGPHTDPVRGYRAILPLLLVSGPGLCSVRDTCRWFLGNIFGGSSGYTLHQDYFMYFIIIP